MSHPNDPPDLDAYNAKAIKSMSITGHGFDVVTHMPCPGCAAPGWMDYPVTAALDGYESLNATIPEPCTQCGRSFKMVVEADSSSTVGSIVQIGGPDVADYLPFMRRES